MSASASIIQAATVVPHLDISPSLLSPHQEQLLALRKSVEAEHQLALDWYQQKRNSPRQPNPLTYFGVLRNGGHPFWWNELNKMAFPLPPQPVIMVASKYGLGGLYDEHTWRTSYAHFTGWVVYSIPRRFPDDMKRWTEPRLLHPFVSKGYIDTLSRLREITSELIN